MAGYCRFVKKLSGTVGWMSVVMILLMILFIATAVVARSLGHAIMGDVECVELGLTPVLLFSLAYSQEMNAHISIGLIVDKFPKKIQNILDIIAFGLTVAVALLVAYAMIKWAISDLTGFVIKTQLMRIAKWPFKLIIAFGCITWAMSALAKMFGAILSIRGQEISEDGPSNASVNLSEGED